MHYAQIRKFDVSNGPGIRSSLFVSGCTHGCPGCFNREYMDFNYGKPWSREIEDDFIEMIQDENVSGVTLLGGEPMDQIKDDDLLNLVKRIKVDTGKNIWIYSGYTFEEIIADPKKRAILSYCDALVDGLFILALKDLRLEFRGSSNQRILDVKKSIEAEHAIWLETYEPQSYTE